MTKRDTSNMTPTEVLTHCQGYTPNQTEYLQHKIIQRFGGPNQAIYIDQNRVEIDKVEYSNPLILPIYNGELSIVQCAVMESGKTISVFPDGLARGFACYGELQHDKAVIITYSLESFFKIASSGLSVALVVLSNLCASRLAKNLKAFDFEQIQFVINQLAQAGFKKLYLPVRPEYFKNDTFQKLEQNTCVRLINQYQKIDENEFLIELTKDEDPEEVSEFLKEAIARLPHTEPLPKGHMAKPFKWGDGRFHLLESGLYFLETNNKGDDYKRYISSPIKVVALTRDNSSTSWGRLLEWYDPDGIKHLQAVSMEFFQSDGVELRKALSYQGMTIAPDAKARSLLQSYLMSYPVEQRALCVDRVGWHDEVYVLPHCEVGQSKDNDLIVYQAIHGLDNRYQRNGTLIQWREEVSKLAQNHSKLVCAISTAFAGQLLGPLEQQNGAGVHFVGKSSKGKSTALFLGCSVWGKPSRFYRTWRATGNALEHTAYMHNDSFLALDEIGEIANPKELGNIVYMLANGLGKARLNKQITAKPAFNWKLIFLSSGEEGLKDIMAKHGQKAKLGQEIRLIDIDVDQSEYGVFDSIDFASDGAMQSRMLVERSNMYYGEAGIAWLEYLCSDKNEIIKQARQLWEQYREPLIDGHSEGHIIRVANTFALIATAGELATQAGITGWKNGTAFKAVQAVFKQWLGNFDRVGNYEDMEILAQIKAFFEAHGNSRFEGMTPDAEHLDKVINRVGYWKIDNGEKKYLVYPEQFKKELCKGLNPKRVGKLLIQRGWLDHLNNGKSTKLTRGIDGMPKAIPMYVFNEKVLTDDLDEL
ncbi:helicase [Acinetobacter sp. KU 011TH]|nr:helicase [Acinetobacter sp. KU 011TH]TDM64273.1 helicase [Acinetobacter sp. KU 013TH]